MTSDPAPIYRFRPDGEPTAPGGDQAKWNIVRDPKAKIEIELTARTVGMLLPSPADTLHAAAAEAGANFATLDERILFQLLNANPCADCDHGVQDHGDGPWTGCFVVSFEEVEPGLELYCPCEGFVPDLLLPIPPGAPDGTGIFDDASGRIRWGPEP